MILEAQPAHEAAQHQRRAVAVLIVVNRTRLVHLPQHRSDFDVVGIRDSHPDVTAVLDSLLDEWYPLALD